jgi:LmeA-like phospholipid-binding
MGRAGRRIIIAAVALLVLLLVADRVGDAVAERVAGDTLQSSQHLAHRPDVNIAGFPFLNQLATGHYDKITVTAKDVPLGRRARGLVLDRLQVVLRHLTVTRSFSHFRAQTATATGTVGLGKLGEVLGVELSYAGGGRVQVAKDLSIAGNTFHLRATAKPYLHHGALAFSDTSVAGVDGVTGDVIDSLTSVFGISIPLQGIPFDVRLTSLRVDSAGLAVTLVGKDLVYTD